jgi:hypothetical protein
MPCTASRFLTEPRGIRTLYDIQSHDAVGDGKSFDPLFEDKTEPRKLGNERYLRRLKF